MNLLNGILQRLSIIEQTDSRLVLRELPLLDWGLAFLLLLITAILWISNLGISAVISLALAFFLVLQSRVRLIIFQTSPNLMQIFLQSPLQSRVVNEISLHQINRAYLHKDDSGSQIILVQTDGSEMGLSVFSHELRDWKEPIVIAINAILHNAHKDEPNQELII